MPEIQSAAENHKFFGLLSTTLLATLYFISRYNYLLFHSLVELFSIVVAFGLFVIAWNSRHSIRNPYLLFIGIAYLFIGLLDLLHTLAYPGMQIFTDYDFYANQLWIGARYLESLTLAIAFLYLHQGRKVRPYRVFGLYLTITTLLIAAIFFWKIFPVCYREGQGLTPFKIISEYIISAILVANIGFLTLNRQRFDRDIFRLLLASLVLTIFSEFAFTFYRHNYGLANLVGHFFKLFSFYLIYKAVVETGITKPFALIFKELTETNRRLNQEIANRRRSEAEREKVIGKLEKALAEVKALSGLLPICASCKKIRDDKGYWNQLEAYITDHSEAEFSHGICPECAYKLYPEIMKELDRK